MKIEINVVPGRSKNDLGQVSVYEFCNDGKSKLITRGNSLQHHALIKNVIKTISNDHKKELWSVVKSGNKIFAVSI